MENKCTDYEIRQAICRGVKINAYISTEGEYFDMNMRPKKSRTGPRGYVRINLPDTQEAYLLHRLVAETFIPNPDKLPTVNHKNGNKSKNNTENLEWATYSYNNTHAVKTGLRVPLNCENHQYATFTNDQVHEICKLLERQVYYDDIIKQLNLVGDIGVVKRRLIMIKTGHAWTKISKLYNIPKSKLTRNHLAT